MVRYIKNALYVMCMAVFIFASSQVVDTPKAQALLISRDNEIEIGQNLAKQVEQKYGLVNDPALQARVARIGAKLAAVSDRADMPYTFKVLNGEEINAFAAPGGPIYLFRGLIDAMPSDDEIAGIIGHELGHIVKRHTVVTMERNMAGQLIFSLLFGNKAQMLQEVAFSAIMAGYSRGEEEEADSLGVIHTMRAGYNPYSSLLGMEKLKDLTPESGGLAGDLFSDHPNTKARIDKISNQISTDFKVRPSVTGLDKSAQVTDGAWNLPPVFSDYGGYKPLLRSYFTAGRIYRISGLADYSADKFYMSDSENGITIYYRDASEPVAMITTNDAMGNNMSVNEMAILTLARIREWINRG